MEETLIYSNGSYTDIPTQPQGTEHSGSSGYKENLNIKNSARGYTFLIVFSQTRITHVAIFQCESLRKSRKGFSINTNVKKAQKRTRKKTGQPFVEKRDINQTETLCKHRKSITNFLII
jgi:hypothetical protein